jgi:predicted HTH transcriptional regulator
MTILIIIIVALVVVGIVLVVALIDARKYGTKMKDEFVGICNSAFDRDTKRQGNLDKIVQLFGERNELTNADVRSNLGVSSRTTVRYMDELERTGKVVQVGKIGHTVTYRLK